MKKVMLDECITKKCAHAIIEYLRLQAEVSEAHFLIEFMGQQGALDGDWTLKLQPPAEWIVISTDCGKQSPRIHAKGPPLQLILPKRGITGFFLAGKTLSQCKGEERARVVISKMPDILKAAAAAEAGTRFKIKSLGSSVVVHDWPLSARQ